jgi:hypothetical protein
MADLVHKAVEEHEVAQAAAGRVDPGAGLAGRDPGARALQACRGHVGELAGQIPRGRRLLEQQHEPGHAQRRDSRTGVGRRLLPQLDTAQAVRRGRPEEGQDPNDVGGVCWMHEPASRRADPYGHGCTGPAGGAHRVRIGAQATAQRHSPKLHSSPPAQHTTRFPPSPHRQALAHRRTALSAAVEDAGSDVVRRG